MLSRTRRVSQGPRAVCNRSLLKAKKSNNGALYRMLLPCYLSAPLVTDILRGNFPRRRRHMAPSWQPTLCPASSPFLTPVHVCG